MKTIRELDGAGIRYLWSKIKTLVSGSVSGKVDKVSSSTDNAVVRFDGTSGNIQNSGVTINDSNHLTAAKLITSGGTSSQFVKGDGSLDSNTYLTSSSLSSYAPLSSPALTGTPTAPTATAGTNTTQIATTAFVHEELIDISVIPYNQGSIIFYDAPLLYNEKTFSSNFPITDALGSNSPFVKCYGPISSYKDWDSDYIPVIPGTELEGEVWAYRASNATGTAGALYVGILRYDKNKKPIAANLGVTYFIANNKTVPSDGVWHQYTGTTTIPTTHTVYNGSTGEGCYYIRVRVFVNLSAGTIPTYICGLKIKNNELASQLGDIETLLASI